MSGRHCSPYALPPCSHRATLISLPVDVTPVGDTFSRNILSRIGHSCLSKGERIYEGEQKCLLVPSRPPVHKSPKITTEQEKPNSNVSSIRRRRSLERTCLTFPFDSSLRWSSLLRLVTSVAYLVRSPRILEWLGGYNARVLR